MLFFVENKEQPEVYKNGWKAVVWAFNQYIKDPGGFGNLPPVSTIGKLIACAIGVLKIAIFAVPAGLIGSAFTEVMDEDSNTEELKKNGNLINEYMLVKSVKRANVFTGILRG